MFRICNLWRLATLLAATLLVSPPCSGQVNEAAGATARSSVAPSIDTPNVVLGRELIFVTKQIENLIGLQQEVMSLRHEIADESSAPGSIDVLSADIQQLSTAFASKQGGTVEALRTELERISGQQKKPDLESGVLPSAPLTQAVAPQAPEAVVPAETTKPSPAETGIKTISFQLDVLTAALDAEEKSIEAQAGQLSQLKRRVSGYEMFLEDRENRLQNLSSRLDSLARLVDVSDSGNGELVALGSYDKRRSYAQSVPYSYTESGIDSLEEGLPGFTSKSESGSSPSSVMGSDYTLKISLIHDRLQRAGVRMQGLKTELEQLTSQVKDFKAKNEVFVVETKSSSDQAAKTIDDVRLKIRNAQQRKLALEDALSDRDGGLNQFVINQMLVYAVYGMVLSIIALFILLRWYPASLTDLIVQQRVFVEVLSMGFLLVTIIILGSAKLIQGEGLAGLLGTIAGYIFVKKTADMANAERNAEAGSFMDRALGQAHIDIATIKGEIARQHQTTGDSQSESAKAAMTKLETRLQEAEQRAKSLTEGITSMTQAKSARQVSRDNKNPL